MTGETENPELIEDVNKLKQSLRSHKGYKTRYQGDLQALQEAMMEAPSKRTSVALENQYNKWKAKCIDVENLMIDLNNFDKDKDYRDDLKQLGNEMAEWLKKTSIAQSQLKEDFKVIAEGDSHRGIKVRLDLKPDKLSTDASPAEFRSWREDFEVYFQSSRFAQGSDREQQRCLLTCLDDDLAEMIKQNVERERPVFRFDFRTEEELIDQDVDCCMDILEGHFESNHPLTLRRMEFMKMSQGRGQSLSQFATSLRGAWTECSFEQMKPHDMLMTILIHGCQNLTIKDKLREVKDKPWKEVKDLIRCWEANKNEDKNPEAARQISKTNGRGQENSKPNRTNFAKAKADMEAKGKCWKCGSQHKTADCRLPADTVCNNCNKRGHKASVCMSKRDKEEKRRPARQRARQVGEDDAQTDPPNESCNAVGTSADEVLFS
jgi:hypothetical protein